MRRMNVVPNGSRSENEIIQAVNDFMWNYLNENGPGWDNITRALVGHEEDGEIIGGLMSRYR